MSRTTNIICTTVIIVAFVVVLFTIVVLTNDMNNDGNVIESTWPSTAEFSQLYTGQDRFSEHATNISDTYVLVDHETGVCYVCTPDGVCALLDAEGEPVREKEAA